MVSKSPASSTAAGMNDRLIIALDVPTAAEAQSMVAKLGDAANFYKVGLQLFTSAGPHLVRGLVESGKKVFLDLKFHDIPNTVAGAVASAAELGATMLTVHAAGGSKMLEAAVEAANRSKSQPRILAVTMLTSLGDADMAELGMSVSMSDHVVRLAQLAKRAGCHGVVASPQEISQIRKAVGSEMLIVTPGIRPSGSAANDQSRTATPAAAIAAGATHLVVGRPITAASDQAAAARAILGEMAQAKTVR